MAEPPSHGVQLRWFFYYKLHGSTRIIISMNFSRLKHHHCCQWYCNHGCDCCHLNSGGDANDDCDDYADMITTVLVLTPSKFSWTVWIPTCFVCGFDWFAISLKSSGRIFFIFSLVSVFVCSSSSYRHHSHIATINLFSCILILFLIQLYIYIYNTHIFRILLLLSSVP